MSTIKAQKSKEQLVSSEFIESQLGDQMELKAISDINCKTGTFSITVKLTTKMLPSDASLRKAIYKVASDNMEAVYLETMNVVSQISKGDENQLGLFYEENGEAKTY